MILTTNTPYPSRKIWCIRACTHQRPQRKEDQYTVSREDQYAVLDIWHVNILEDIKRGPTPRNPQYAVSNPLDTPEEKAKRSCNALPIHRRQRVISYTFVIVQFLVSFVNLEVLIKASRRKKIPYEVMAEPTLKEYIVNAQGIFDKQGEGKITIWEELVEKFFCKFYPESYNGEEEMLDEGDNWGIDPLEFISRINSSFDKHMKIDGRTKKLLFYAWMNGSWNKRQMNDRILGNNNTTADLFFKPYLITHRKCDTKKEDEQSQTKRKYSNTSEFIDEQPNKRMCKAEKFEAI
ncbi:hypothetical protein Tco_1246704 [Tanacetum coccineum]